MQSVQLAASEIWVTLIFCGILYLFRDGLNQKKITKILLIACIIRLSSDAVSWAFDGVPGTFLGVLTKITIMLHSSQMTLFLWFFPCSSGSWSRMRTKSRTLF